MVKKPDLRGDLDLRGLKVVIVNNALYGQKTSITREMMPDQSLHELVELSVHQFKSGPIPGNNLNQ